MLESWEPALSLALAHILITARSTRREAHSSIPDFSPASYNEPDHDCPPARKTLGETSQPGDRRDRWRRLRRHHQRADFLEPARGRLRGSAFHPYARARGCTSALRVSAIVGKIALRKIDHSQRNRAQACDHHSQWHGRR